jgi:hypothetical protein
MDPYAPIAIHRAKTAQPLQPTAVPASVDISSKAPPAIPAPLHASNVQEHFLRALLAFSVTNSLELIACPAQELISMIQETLHANCAAHPAKPVSRATIPALHVSLPLPMMLRIMHVYHHALRVSLETMVI